MICSLWLGAHAAAVASEDIGPEWLQDLLDPRQL